MTDPGFDFNETDRELEDIDLYDHERVEINKVFAALSENIGKPRSLESFSQEAVERLGEIGFRAKVLFYEATNPSTGEKYTLPQISIVGRIEKPEEFDHARQQHEVQTDVLGVRGGDDVRVSKPVAMGGASFKRSGSGLYVPGK